MMELPKHAKRAILTADLAFKSELHVNDSDRVATQPLSGQDWTLATLQSMPDEVCGKDIHGRIMTANRAMASRYGFAHSDALIGKTAFDYLPGEAARELSDAEGMVIRSGKAKFDLEQRIVGANGNSRWVKISTAPLYDDNAIIIGIVSISRDITARKETERLMLAQANLLDMVAQSAPIGEILNKIVAVVEEHMPGINGSVWLLSEDGTTFQQLMVPNPPNLYPGILDDDETTKMVEVAFSAIAGAEAVVVSDLASPYCSPDQDAPQIAGIRAFASSPIFSSDGKALGVFNICSSMVMAPQDYQIDLIAMAAHMVSAALERKETEEHTKFLASHDTLTGLPNRRMFEEQLTFAIEEARGQGSQVILAFFDLDNFKLINDSLGHRAGDDLLRIVAERANQNLRRGDLVGRLGGDEFVMFMKTTLPETDGIKRRLGEIHRAISAPLSLAGRTLQVTCSMGVASFPDHAQKSLDLIAHADTAMYCSKTFGRDNIQFFSNDMADLANEQLIINADLHQAISRGEFVLHYQPQIDLNNGRIFAAEALVRWHHPTKGLLAPGQFIKTAEDTGLIVPLGDWVLLEACRQNKRWQTQGLSPIVISVNVSARQFREPDYVSRVVAALEQSELDARFLQLELTESLVMQDMALAIGKMRKLEELGVQFAIDDFGTGHSSLSVLKSLPVRCLKIDRSFVRDIPHDESDKVIVAAIIAMAQTLNLRIIAEGVETSEQLEFLHAHDCYQIQGFFYSRPVDADAFKNLLAGSGLVAPKFVRPKAIDRVFPRLAVS